MQDCDQPLHRSAVEGLRLFNAGLYFEAHEALEHAWLQDKTPIRDLYRGILQAAVVYLHVTRRNYVGAVKVFERSRRWLRPWPAVCRGIQVERLRLDLEHVVRQVQAAQSSPGSTFDPPSLQPIRWDDFAPGRQHTCDRCGHLMSRGTAK